MQGGDAQDGFSGVVDTSGDAVQEDGATDVSFSVRGGRELSDENIPPGEDQCDKSGHELIAVLVVRGETSPGPIVFEIGERIFAVGAVAVKLCNGGDGMDERGDEYGIFETIIGAKFGDETTLLLRYHRGFFVLPSVMPSQNNQSSFGAPAKQLRTSLSPLPALARIAPDVVAVIELMDKRLDFTALFDFEEIVTTT